jgi:nitrogen-specific signal transduction histidine kinase
LHDFCFNSQLERSGEIEQTLLNLYVNAADAKLGNGNLFLKTQNVIHKDITDKAYNPKPRI